MADSKTKKVNVLNQAEGISFEIQGEKGPRNVVVSEKMTVADAELIAGIFPGVYVEVVETDDKAIKTQTAQ